MGGAMTFNVLIALVILNVMAVISLWRVVARQPVKPKKQFIAALLHSKPIVPKHRRPEASGDGFSSLVSDNDRQFFRDFDDFADVVNWWFGDEHVGTGWRLQELPETERKHSLSDAPQFGRRYDVFYNQVRLGTLEVSPSVGYDAKNPDVHTSVQLERVRLLPIGTVRAFLNGIALHVCRPDPITKEYGEARAAIEECLTDALWQAHQIAEFEVDEDQRELDLQLNGAAVWYSSRRQAPAFKRPSSPLV
jgi:hypothetical protein